MTLSIRSLEEVHQPRVPERAANTTSATRPKDAPRIATDALGRLLGGLYDRVTQLEGRIRDLEGRLSKHRKLMTIRQVAESSRYPGLTDQSLRSLIKRGEATGFDRCLRRNGRRIFIDTAAMERWFEQQAQCR